MQSGDGERGSSAVADTAGRRVLAALAGATLAGLLQALLFPQTIGLLGIDLKFLVVHLGNLVPAVLLGLAAPVGARIFRLERSLPLAFWLGTALGVGALAGSWIGDARGWGGVWKFSVPALTALGFAAAVPLARLGAPSGRWNAGIAGAGLLAAAVLLTGVGRVDIEQAESVTRFEQQPLPPLAAAGPETGADVLLISIDTLRADAMLRPDVPTPHLDALRERSLWSDYGLAPAPATLPSHVTMLTGTGVLRHGTRENTGRIPSEIPTLAEHFRAGGWRTLALVSNGVLRAETGVARGFDVYQNLTISHPATVMGKNVLWKSPRGTWLGWTLPHFWEDRVLRRLLRIRVSGEETVGVAPGTITRDLALGYLDRLLEDERPYLFFLHFMDPHQPYRPEPGFGGRLSAGMELPERYAAFEPGSLLICREVQSDLRLGEPEAVLAAKVLERVYLEELLFIDDAIGRVLERIEATGRPTWIVFTSDHGEQFGEHQLMIHNNSVYEPLLRVPFLLAGPGVEPGLLELRPYLEDVVPTLLRRCGLPLPDLLEGRDLLDPQPGTRHVYVGTSPNELAFYDGAWKLILDYTGLGTQEMELEPTALFNIEDDPAEESNLLRDDRDRAREMFEKARALAKFAAAGELAEMSEEDRRILDALGYGEAGAPPPKPQGR